MAIHAQDARNNATRRELPHRSYRPYRVQRLVCNAPSAQELLYWAAQRLAGPAAAQQQHLRRRCQQVQKRERLWRDLQMRKKGSNMMEQMAQVQDLPSEGPPAGSVYVCFLECQHASMFARWHDRPQGACRIRPFGIARCMPCLLYADAGMRQDWQCNDLQVRTRCKTTLEQS